MAASGELKEIYFENTDVDINIYPFNLPFFTTRDKLKFHTKVTFFVGENGTGKSTLIEAIAVASGFNPAKAELRNLILIPGPRIQNFISI